jgi:hypothetical protein
MYPAAPTDLLPEKMADYFDRRQHQMQERVMSETKWQPINTAPPEIERERPVLVLVPRSLPPDKGAPPWKAVAAYRSSHHQWRAADDERNLVPVHWTEIPVPFPPGLP